MRQRAAGIIVNPKRGTWGKSSRHPMYMTWKNTLQSLGRVSEWDDFWIFVEHVGAIAPERSRLKRLRKDEPIGPGNWFWRPETDSIGDGSPQAVAAYQKRYRDKSKAQIRDGIFRRKYGITHAEYDAMLELQGGGCRICGGTNGKRMLAIDHCHNGGGVRGLLCTGCNTGLGGFKDSTQLLQAAIAYLGSAQLTKAA